MNSHVRLADRRDIPALCKIWQVCFADSEAYIRFFYRAYFEHMTVLLYVQDGKAVSMLHLMNADFAAGETLQQARLLYAGGTLPAYRKNGCFSALIASAVEQAKQDGSALFLKPYPLELMAYYRKFGFEPDAAFHIVSVEAGDVEPLSVTPLSAHDYNRLRNAAFSSHPYVKWDDAHVQFCIAENAYCGGKTVAVDFNGKSYFLMGFPEDGTLVITETDLPLSQLQRCTGALCEWSGTKQIKAYMPDFSCGVGEELISSAVCNAPLQNTYVNLILI